MSKMNIEVMEQLLKDLAANIGYELIPNPFDTPFEEASLKTLPDDKQFVWPIPASVLNDEAHKDFRKMWVDADLIDTIAELSWTWPSNEEEHMAILLIDITRSRRGTVKFVNAIDWKIEDEEYMLGLCDMLIHDLYPGEDMLAFEVNGDMKDLWLDEPWNEQVCVIAARDIESLLPSNYIFKPEQQTDSDILGSFFDIEPSTPKETTIKLEKSAIVVSTMGKLNPTRIEYKGEPITLSLKNKIVLFPHTSDKTRPLPQVEDFLDLDRVVEMFGSEEVLRQLPISRRLSWYDMFNLKINYGELLTVSLDEWEKIQSESLQKMSDSLESQCTTEGNTNNLQ